MRFLFLLVFFFSSIVQAGAIRCEPKTAYNQNAVGSTTITTKTPAGTVDAWWCNLGIVTDSGAPRYNVETFIVLNGYSAKLSSFDVLRRIIAAPDTLAAINTEITNNGYEPLAGTNDKYQWDLLKYQGCLSLTVKPYLINILDLPSDFCGQQPIPPAPSADVYKVGSSGSILFKLLPNGNVDTVISGRKAAASSLCDCTVKTTIGGNTNYCPLSGQLKTEVASCIKQ